MVQGGKMSENVTAKEISDGLWLIEANRVQILDLKMELEGNRIVTFPIETCQAYLTEGLSLLPEGAEIVEINTIVSSTSEGIGGGSLTTGLLVRIMKE
jgi:hypothetical protein